MIYELTPQQKDLIHIYRDKWQKKATSTQKINRHQTTETIKKLYEWIGQPTPQILFFDSPDIAIKSVDINPPSRMLRLQLDRQSGHLCNQIKQQVSSEIWTLLTQEINTPLAEQLESQLLDFLTKQLWENLRETIEFQAILSLLHNCLHPERWAHFVGVYDFCISVLGCDCNQKDWDLHQSLIENCGWLFPFQDICLVCDRPNKIYFNEQQRLHAEGELAVEFASGFGIYAYQGVRLPEKYGKINSKQWDAKWLLEEQNAELRRVLIQGIGYARICEELGAKEIDSWREYTLLEVINNFDVEPVRLLKMICPSTNFIHVLRVPPDVNYAKDAIRWVNWGLDAEEFAVES